MYKAILFAGVLLASPSYAQNAQCGPHADVVARLAGQYQETRQMRGIANGTHILEIFAAENGTWTAVLTDLGGQSCIVSFGEAFELITDKLPTGAPL